MKSIRDVKWVGSRSNSELDLILLTHNPNVKLENIIDDVNTIINNHLANKPIEWCPFHWFEEQYLFPPQILPIHLFLFGSIIEMRAVEHDSVFSTFCNILNLSNNNSIVITELHRQRLVDMWRLRSCFIQYALAPKILKKSTECSLRKALQYIIRSYSFIQLSSTNDNLLLDVQSCQKILNQLTEGIKFE